MAVRLRSMNSPISASDMTIFARWLVPTRHAYQAPAATTVTGMPFLGIMGLVAAATVGRQGADPPWARDLPET